MGKPGKVMEFVNGYFQAWKSPKGFEKNRNFLYSYVHLRQVLTNPYAF